MSSFLYLGFGFLDGLLSDVEQSPPSLWTIAENSSAAYNWDGSDATEPSAGSVSWIDRISSQPLVSSLLGNGNDNVDSAFSVQPDHVRLRPGVLRLADTSQNLQGIKAFLFVVQLGFGFRESGITIFHPLHGGRNTAQNPNAATDYTFQNINSPNDISLDGASGQPGSEIGQISFNGNPLTSPPAANPGDPNYEPPSVIGANNIAFYNEYGIIIVYGQYTTGPGVFIQTIGSFIAGNENYRSYGDYYNMSLWTEIPTQDEFERAVGSLAHRYEITGKLPGSHPYKNSPPIVI